MFATARLRRQLRFAVSNTPGGVAPSVPLIYLLVWVIAWRHGIRITPTGVTVLNTNVPATEIANNLLYLVLGFALC